MNVVNYTIDNEMLGFNGLGTDWHRRLRVQLTSNPNAFCASKRDVFNQEPFTTRLPFLLKEKEFDLKSSNINKIFTAQWLDERKCILGTKCNKLVILDTFTGLYSVQEPLKSHPNSRNVPNHCGIHSISINPSRTMLATGASNVNDIAVYNLPSMEPVMVGHNAHKYWIFDSIWLDDEYVVTGAGDNRLALWNVNNSKPCYSLKSNRIGSSNVSGSPDSSIDSDERNKILNYMDGDGQIDRRSLKRTSPCTPPSTSRIPIRASPTTTSPSGTKTLFSYFHINRPIVPPTPTTTLFSQVLPLPRIELGNRIRLSNPSSNRNRESPASVLALNQQENQIPRDDQLSDEDEDNEYVDSDDEEERNRRAFDFYRFFEIDPSTDNLNENNTNEAENNNPEAQEEESENDSSDEQTDESRGLHLKRRRINVGGKFKLTNEYQYKAPLKVIKCKQSKRIRALAFNPRRNEISAISMNAAFHYFDINRFEQTYTKNLSPLKENVCLTINNDYTIYAIGSASHVQLLDANNNKSIIYQIFVKKDIGVRSLNFRNNLLSIGTGIGTVMFYDIRANKFLCKDTDKNTENQNHLSLQTRGGWILRDETYYVNVTYAFNLDNSHAIYSHSYDPTGTRLLTAGGPLTINLYGHYVGVWD